MANDVKTPFDELNRLITTITDPEQKELTKAMAVLVAALGVGTDVDLLAQETGYPREFIFGIATCMREAQLWGENVVDDREWWEGPDEFRVGLFAHAMVALGQAKRMKTLTGCVYTDPATGEVQHAWQDRAGIH